MATTTTVANTLGRLLGYLRTWQNPDGLFGGTIATWWNSTLETAVPHPMNHFPMILGFLELHRGGVRLGGETGVGGGDWLAEARRVGDGLVASILPDGMLRNAWGDIPRRRTGTVHFAAPALALAELHADSREDRHLDGARRLLKTIETRWMMGRINYDGVANQGLKWCEAMLAYARETGERQYFDHAVWLARKTLDLQIRHGPCAGAIYQSRGDQHLISVYQGKCLAPLVRLYEATDDATFLDAAERLAKFLLERQAPQGVFINYLEPQGTLYWLTCQAFVRFDYRIFRRRVPMYRLWQPLIRGWHEIPYPSFIARAGDSLRGLWLLSKHKPEFGEAALRLTERLLAYQLPHGGIPNTVGYYGDAGREDWQDVCCPTRWNVYAFLLLATLARDLGCTQVAEVPCPADPFERPVGPERKGRFRETRDGVEYFLNNELIARLSKPSGASSYLADGWDDDLTGPRNRANMGLP